MSERLTDEQLAAIRARADVAAPGPWTWRGGNLVTLNDTARSISMGRCVLAIDGEATSINDLVEWEYVREAEDAEFIAASREDIPALLAHIDTLTTERNALVDVIMRHTDICVFGGGHVRNGVARRDSCKYGHPGCACADWIATRGLDDEARWRAEIEARVAELFAERFPPGSDGPPVGFDIGTLYEQATCEVAEKVKEEIQAAFQRDADRFLGREVDGAEHG